MRYEDFIEETWDYVSENIVSDDCWDKNQKLILLLTHKLYRQFKKATIRDIDGVVIHLLPTKTCGNMLESIFKILIEEGKVE